MEISRLTRDGTAEPVSPDQILRHERGQGNINFPYSADNEQDSQPNPVDPYSCYLCDHTWNSRSGICTVHTAVNTAVVLCSTPCDREKSIAHLG